MYAHSVVAFVKWTRLAWRYKGAQESTCRAMSNQERPNRLDFEYKKPIIKKQIVCFQFSKNLSKNINLRG